MCQLQGLSLNIFAYNYEVIIIGVTEAGIFSEEEKTEFLGHKKVLHLHLFFGSQVKCIDY